MSTNIHEKREELRHEVQEHDSVTRNYVFTCTVVVEAENEAEARKDIEAACGMYNIDVSEVELVEVE